MRDSGLRRTVPFSWLPGQPRPRFQSLLLVVSLLLGMSGCGGGGGGSTQTQTPPTAATPTFSLTAATYSTTQTVTISDATDGATIYYTINGASPTISSTVYSGPITIATTETLKAIATASGYNPSSLASAVYTITCTSTLLGDVNGDGQVTQADADEITAYLAGTIPGVTCPALADANQDGTINAADATAISERVAGVSRGIGVSLEGGLPNKTFTGGVAKVSAQEDFFPFNVTSGAVRIQSASTGYDSGSQSMVFEADGRSLYWHWNTAGLKPASDYLVSVTLNQTGNLPALTGANAQPQQWMSEIGTRSYEPVFLSVSVDAAAPAPGIPLSFTRSWAQDSYSSPAMGPFGLGWKHTFDIQLTAFTDGTVAFIAPGGVDRIFTTNGGGTYTASPGDHGVLTLDPNGSFQLREKNGFIYRFLSGSLLLEYVQDRNGNRITCNYNGSGQLTSLQDSSGATFQLQYNSAGLISVLTDQNGRQTQYAYDSTNTHLTSVTAPDGAVTSYSYVSGQTIQVNDRLQEVTSPANTHFSIAYNANGQVSTTQMDGGASELTYAYPSAGETTITDAGGGVTTLYVNQNLQPVQVIDPLENATTYLYDSSFNLTQITDPLNRTQTFSYDGNGNLTGAVDPAGNQISMTYDPTYSQLVSFKDARGYTTSFTLDSNGNMTKETYPNGSSQSYAYNLLGKLISRTDAKGQTTNYAYNSAGQITTRTYPDTSTDAYTYDSFGDLISAVNSTGTITLGYDSYSRLTSKTYPGNRTIQYQYDSSGRRTQMTDPDGNATNYSYDTVGRLSQILNGSNQAIVSYQYDSLGRVNQKTLANGAYAQYTYDLASHIQQITNLAPSGSIISSFGYSYDADGEVLSKTTIEGLESYTYDQLGQLTNVSYPNGTTAAYSYDAAGNRTSATESSTLSSYSTNNLNQYTAVGVSSYTYDANGNTTAQTAAPANTPSALSYDFRNRLTQAQSSAGSVSYTYNALGERASRTDSSGTVQYLWDGPELLTEQTTVHQTTAGYTWGRTLDEAVSMTRSGSTYYYAEDALESISDLLSAAGQSAEHYTYTAFGIPSKTSSLGNPWMYTGARYDPNTSLISLRARWYSPALGRFVTSDPIGLLGDVNSYRYVFNAPTLYSDPAGLWGVPNYGGSSESRTGFNPSTLAGAGWAVVGAAIGAIVGTLIEPGGGTIEGADIGAAIGTGVGLGIYAKTQYDQELLDLEAESALDNALDDLDTLGDLDDIEDLDVLYGLGDFGGECPTFIQIPSKADRAAPQPSDQNLFGRIAVPINGALLRSDIPIFGTAGGTDFKEYRAEYGAGKNPSKWTLIESSMTPQPTNKVGLAEMQQMQGDIDIRGNLATWNTGLKEWEHLPWHPASDPTDLRGEYTVRLVVTGKDGKTVEDRIDVEVGRVITQVLPGDAISTDNKVTMHFEPQSLQAPFRLYTIDPLTTDAPAAPAGMQQVGPAYSIREPGDRFMKPVVLRFDLTGKANARDLSQDSIYAYDPKAQKWEPLTTTQGTAPDSLETSLLALPEPVAYFTVFHGPGSHSAPKDADPKPNMKPASLQSDGSLVFNTFATDTGEWAARDQAFGGSVSRDKTATPDGSYCLKITNQNAGGDFAVTAVSTPFRADLYPIVSFDYRILPGVRTDFYVRIGQRWYRVGFTGDPGDLRNMDVGITTSGQIDGIVTDGKWRSASFDLNRMLATKTALRNVDEIIMADWRVGGYMKLDFGTNAKGATFYLNNFKIRHGENSQDVDTGKPMTLLIDDFDGTSGLNRLGGAYDIFSNPGTQNVVMSRVSSGDASHGGALSLKYDVTGAGSYGGYWTQLRDTRGDQYDQITLRVKPSIHSNGFLLGIKRRDGVEIKVPAERYWGPASSDGWRMVAVPLAVFGSRSEPNGLDLLSISFANTSAHGKGELLIDDLRFDRSLTFVPVTDFENGVDSNLLTQKNWTFTRGAAALDAGLQQPTTASDSQSLRLSYGGTVGLDLGHGDFSYAGWVAGLGGIDASRTGYLQFKVRGQSGGERFNIYLDDGTTRKLVDSSKYVAITKEWKDVSIPIDAFAKQGVDISHLAELQFVFEWRQMSGTIYVDDIRLSELGQATK